MQPQTPKTEAQRNPISIALLFYVVTLAAIVAASLGRLSSDELVTIRSLLVMILTGSILGLCLGFATGLFYFKSLKGMLIGMGVGLIMGAGAGALALVSHHHFLANMTIAFAGCWIVILMMLATARYQAQVE